MQKTLAIIGIILLVVAGVFLGWWLRGFRPVVIEPVVQTDTLWLHDTIKIQQPAPKAKWIHDTTYLAVRDTVQMHDTTYVPIPRETTFYTDASSYEAWVTGFRASLDSIHVFQQTAIVEKVVYQKVKRKWGIGVNAGWGVMVDPFGGKATVHTGPTVSVGVSYNF